MTHHRERAVINRIALSQMNTPTTLKAGDNWVWISEKSHTGTVADEPIVKFVTVNSSSEIAAARMPAPSTAGAE